jgi:hypothetical protein
MKTPPTIRTYCNAFSGFPLVIFRNLWTHDAEGKNERLLRNVRITIESADFRPSTVKEEGFCGDWTVHLSDDSRFFTLSKDEKDFAADAVSNLLEDMAARFANHEHVPVNADEERTWHPDGNANL